MGAINSSVNWTPFHPPGRQSNALPAPTLNSNHSNHGRGHSFHERGRPRTIMDRRNSKNARRSATSASRSLSSSSNSMNNSASNSKQLMGSFAPPMYEHALVGEWKELLHRCQTHPAEASYSDRCKNTALHLACRRQPPSTIVAALIRADAMAATRRTFDGLTPLHFACYCGASIDVVALLLFESRAASSAYPSAPTTTPSISSNHPTNHHHASANGSNITSSGNQQKGSPSATFKIAQDTHSYSSHHHHNYTFPLHSSSSHGSLQKMHNKHPHPSISTNKSLSSSPTATVLPPTSATVLTDRRGRTPLHCVCAGFRTTHRPLVIRALLKSDPACATIPDERGRTPLSLMYDDYAEEIEDILHPSVSREEAIKRCGFSGFSGMSGNGFGAGGYSSSKNYSRGGGDNAGDCGDGDLKECWDILTLLLKAAYSGYSDEDNEDDEHGYHNHHDFDKYGSADNYQYHGGGDSVSSDDAKDNTNIVHMAKTYGSHHQNFHPQDHLNNSPHHHNSSSKLENEVDLNYTPFRIVHAAAGCMYVCPPGFIRLILKLSGLEKVKERDGDFNLPLHIALRATPPSPLLHYPMNSAGVSVGTGGAATQHNHSSSLSPTFSMLGTVMESTTLANTTSPATTITTTGYSRNVSYGGTTVYNADFGRSFSGLSDGSNIASSNLPTSKSTGRSRNINSYILTNSNSIGGGDVGAGGCNSSSSSLSNLKQEQQKQQEQLTQHKQKAKECGEATVSNKNNKNSLLSPSTSTSTLSLPSTTSPYSTIIQDLIEIYPEAASIPDESGKLPLIIAIETGKPWEHAIRPLLDAYPEALENGGAAGVQASLMVALTNPVSQTVRIETAWTVGKLMQRWTVTAEQWSCAAGYGANEFILGLIKISGRYGSPYAKLGHVGSNSGTVANEWSGIQAAMLVALSMALENVPVDFIVIPDTINAALDVAFNMLTHQDAIVRNAAARVVGSSLELLGSSDQAFAVMRNTILLSRLDVDDSVSTSVSDVKIITTMKSITDITETKTNDDGKDINTTTADSGAGIGVLTNKNKATMEMEIEFEDRTSRNSSVVEKQQFEDLSTSVAKHGRASACFRILSSDTIGKIICEHDTMFKEIRSLVKDWMLDEDAVVRGAACLTVGAVLGRSMDVSSTLASASGTLRELRHTILKCMRATEEDEVHMALARGLVVATKMKPDLFICKHGMPILDGALMLAMSSGSLAVQKLFHSFLWLALGINNGVCINGKDMKEGGGVGGCDHNYQQQQYSRGLSEYMVMAEGENGRIMMSLVTKVLSKIVSIDDFEVL